MSDLKESFQYSAPIREERKIITETTPETGVVVHEERYKDGLLHCDDGPAWVYRDGPTGLLTIDQWYESGKPFLPSAEERAAWLQKSGERIAPGSPAAAPALSARKYCP